MRQAIWLIAIAAIAVALAGPAEAGTISFATGGYLGGSGGGEFSVDVFSGQYSAVGHSPPSGSLFQTFCLEKTESISLGSATYYYELSDTAYYGGEGATGDKLDAESKWLYYNFWNGTLTGYNFANTGSPTRKQDADQLQKAFWYSEGEISSLTSGSDAATWYALAVAAVAADTSGVGLWNHYVRVVNIWTDSTKTTRAQDQMVVVPLPAAGLAGLVLLGGLGVVSTVRRRRRKI